MIINIFTDPHLNVSRQAHTTRESSMALNEKLFQAGMAAKSDKYINYCAGDLFDKAFNPEWAIIQGIKVAKDCHVLSGNHDETNREGTKCSLEVVRSAGTSKIYRTASVGGTYWKMTEHGVYMVPHHSSQENFVTSLRQAASNSNGRGTLMVHCNRGEIIGNTPDSILVISKELEDELLKSFKRIFYGHEHGSHSNKVEGDIVTSRAVVLGNTHPTSFSDISDKYRYEYDPEADVLTRYKIWDKQSKYLKVDIQQGLTSQPDDTYDFIEVVGASTRSHTLEFIESLRVEFPDVFMIRPNVSFPEEGQVMEVTVDEPVNLSESIFKDLEGSDMQPLFKKLLGNIQ